MEIIATGNIVSLNIGLRHVATYLQAALEDRLPAIIHYTDLNYRVDDIFELDGVEYAILSFRVLYDGELFTGKFPAPLSILIKDDTDTTT